MSLTVSWGQNEVQTSRVLFYFRVLPLCLTKMPEATFAEEIAPAMLLYPYYFILSVVVVVVVNGFTYIFALSGVAHRKAWHHLGMGSIFSVLC